MKQIDNATKGHGLLLSVGHSFTGEGQFTFPQIVDRNKDKIKEVYFAFTGIPSGRSSLGAENGYFDYETTERLISDLLEIVKMGKELDLLLNANCNGGDALSRAHERQIYSILDYLSYKGCMPKTVTTASPVTAKIIKSFDLSIDVRASVNMRICTVKGIQYVEDIFDSFCIFRDVNRDLEKLGELSRYLRKNGKGITLLVNSGCLRGCSMQTFHDNAVAHEAEIFTKDNLPWAGASGCRAYLSRPENHVAFLQNTWIRPEDLFRYEGLIDCAKLATRMHAIPSVVIEAYAKGYYHGNLADLFEPGHGPTFAPYVIDNDKFPKDWFEKTTSCDKNCEKCGYCASVKENVFVNTEH